MALKQRIFCIFTRPFVDVSTVKIYLNNKTELFMTDPLMRPSSGSSFVDPHKKIVTFDNENGGGGWILEYQTNSWEDCRTKVKELIKKVGEDQLLVTELIENDFMVVPEE